MKKGKKIAKSFIVSLLVISNLLFGFPVDIVINSVNNIIQDQKIVDVLYWASKDSDVVDKLIGNGIPKVIGEAQALTTTYNFGTCGSTCDSDTTWHASDDDVDIFPFINNSANRNSHTENLDADYTALASSDDSRFASANPGSADEIFLWLEMDIAEDPADIAQINFIYEGYTTSTASFSIFVKDDTTAYQNDVAWTRIGLAESITASTEETMTRTLSDTNFADYIDANGMITWAVTESVSQVVVSTDYVAMEVITNTVEQEGYRWRNDDGDEDAATWIDAQDTNITQPTATNTRLRTIINDTAGGNQATTQYQLEYKLSSDSTYRPVQASSGSIAYASLGTASSNQSTQAYITAPATVNRGDLLVMTIATKHPTAAPTTPAGWTAISNNQVSGGLGASGADAGAVYATIFTREAEGWEGSAIINVDVPSGNSVEGQIIRFTKGTGKEWDLAATTGTDAVADLSWSVTGAADPGITANDMILAVSAVNADTGANTTAFAWASEAITATGLSMGTQTERNESGSTGGNDVDLVLSTHAVSSGTASSAPTFTMTASGGTASASAPTGGTIILRIRQVDAPIQLALSDNITASGDATTAQLTAPSGAPAFVAGRMQDDENPADTIDINDSEYTELEWSMTATSTAVDDEVYQFRVTANGQVITDYTVTPQWTIGSASANPTFTQSTHRWYVDNDATDPTEVWGTPDIAENTTLVLIPTGNDPPDSSQELRLRVNLTVNTDNLTVSTKYFKLQYKAGTDSTCTTDSWTDVNSGNAWVFATSGATDGADITAVLSNTTTDKGQEYVKSRPTQVNHVAASSGEIIEYDFHIVGTNSTANTQYSFRVVETDSAGTAETVLDAYTNCPTLTTEPGTGDLLRHGNVFSSGSEKGFFWVN